jgi:amidase
MALDMQAGYSSLGGQVRSPYAPTLDEKGAPVVWPGGSSTGSVEAVAAGLAAAAIGTETDGSLLGQVVKPTVGLISRAGVIPIGQQSRIRLAR